MKKYFTKCQFLCSIVGKDRMMETLTREIFSTYYFRFTYLIILKQISECVYGNGWIWGKFFKENGGMGESGFKVMGRFGANILLREGL